MYGKLYIIAFLPYILRVTAQTKRNMKKFIMLIGIFIIFTAGLGAQLYLGCVSVTVEHEGRIILQKEYKIKAKTSFRVSLEFKGDYAAFFEENKEKNDVSDLSCINDSLSRDIEAVFNEVYKAPVDASIDFSSSGFKYLDGKDGKAADQKAFAADFYKNFGGKVKIKTVAVKPGIQISDLAALSQRRSKFSTSYSTSHENRKHNISLASNRLDGITVKAGSELSFNAIVGARTYENGFLDSKIIFKGEFVEGVGGGVCQVSTTLYNAWLKAGLAVVKRKSHSLTVSYVSPSFDAMVSQYNDLILKNDSPHDVFISSKTDGNNITISVFGQKTTRTVVLKSKIIKVIPCNEYEISYGELDWKENEFERVLVTPQDGLVSVGTREIFENGKLVSSEEFGISAYSPRKGKIIKREIAPGQ